MLRQATSVSLTQVVSGSYTGPMEVHFTPEEPARLSKVATDQDLDPEELVKDAALRLVEDDVRLHDGVSKSLEKADRGQFIEEQGIDARVKRMFQS
jgi:predicted transcriptional regulator